MIKRELAKDPKLANQSWDRFLPKLPKKSLSKRYKPHIVRQKKKDKPLFPPPQTPRKIDLQMESGEYFLKGPEKKVREKEVKEVQRQEKKRLRDEERRKDFVPPVEDVPKKKRKVEGTGGEVTKKKKKDKENTESEKAARPKKRQASDAEESNLKTKKKKAKISE